MRAPFNADSHPRDDLHWPILNKKVALVPKRATMHTVSIPGTLGTHTWHLCYIRTATLLNLLHIGLLYTSHTAANDLPAPTEGVCKIRWGVYALNSVPKSGMLSKENIEGVLESLSESTRR